MRNVVWIERILSFSIKVDIFHRKAKTEILLFNFRETELILLLKNRNKIFFIFFFILFQLTSIECLIHVILNKLIKKKSFLHVFSSKLIFLRCICIISLKTDDGHKQLNSSESFD